MPSEPRTSQRAGGQKSAIVDAVLGVAAQIGVKTAQLGLAWELERARRLLTSAVPIIGARTTGQLDGYPGALDITLDDTHHTSLSEVSTPVLDVPHDNAKERIDDNLGRLGSRFILDRPVA